MQERYDVIIVGAGPAGVSTALYAKRRGVSVLLVDKRRFPRDKICGDGISTKSMGYLRDLGILDEVRAQSHEQISAAILGAPSGAQVHFALNPEGNPENPNVVCRREIFDNILVRAARQEVDVLEGWAVNDILLTPGGGACGIRCQSPDGDLRQYAGRVIVGADGFNSIVARRLGAYHHDKDRWLVATRQYFRDLDIPPHTAQLHFLEDTLPGFFWLFPTGDGTANVGLGSVHATIKRQGGLRGMHERILASDRFRKLFARATSVSDIKGWNLPTPNRKRIICGDGFVLVGDAAGVVDPFTGEGIGNAMCSGEVAARAITKAFESAETSRVELSEYAVLLWKELGERELARRYRLRSLARHRGLINLIVGRAAKHAGTLDWLAKMTYEADGPKRMRALLSPLTYLKLLFVRKD
jgi:geranylgeranyl reductase family protein